MCRSEEGRENCFSSLFIFFSIAFFSSSSSSLLTHAHTHKTVHDEPTTIHIHNNNISKKNKKSPPSSPFLSSSLVFRFSSYFMHIFIDAPSVSVFVILVSCYLIIKIATARRRQRRRRPKNNVASLFVVIILFFFSFFFVLFLIP